MLRALAKNGGFIGINFEEGWAWVSNGYRTTRTPQN